MTVREKKDDGCEEHHHHRNDDSKSTIENSPLFKSNHSNDNGSHRIRELHKKICMFHRYPSQKVQLYKFIYYARSRQNSKG